MVSRLQTPSRSSRWLPLVWLPLVFGAAACSVLLKVDETQCETNDDCLARGDDFAETTCSAEKVCVKVKSWTAEPRFACADKPDPITDSEAAQLDINLTDFGGGRPDGDLLVRLCTTVDCASPHASFEAETPLPEDEAERAAGFVLAFPQDPGKEVRANVTQGFEGYFEVKSESYLPTFRFTSPRLTNNTYLSQILLREAEVEQFAGLVSQGSVGFAKATHALLFVLAQDCDREPVRGITFEVDSSSPNTLPFFVSQSNNTPNTKDTATDASGRGGFLNIPEGAVKITARWQESGDYFGEASIPIRAGSVSTVAILPTPP